MDEIPDDIKAAAARAWYEDLHMANNRFGGVEIIARALLSEREDATKAERERIAHFVETEMTLDPEGSDFIATAIRSGARP